jgi:hypothetical protein
MSSSPTVGESVERLADAFRSEKRLIDELIAITRRQRAALAAEDLQAVGDSAHAIQRVLFTLSEARRRRRAINRMISGTDNLALRDLEDTLGNTMTEAIRAARDELDGAAMLLSDEVRINRSVLRETLA